MPQQAMVELCPSRRPFSHRDKLPLKKDQTEHQAGPTSGSDQWGKCCLRTPTVFQGALLFQPTSDHLNCKTSQPPQHKRCPFRTPRHSSLIHNSPPSSYDRTAPWLATKAPTVLHKGHKPGHHQASRVVRVGHKAVRRDDGLSNKQNRPNSSSRQPRTHAPRHALEVPGTLCRQL